MTCGNCCDNVDMLVAKLITVGSERACILPEDALKRLQVNGDDSLLLTETSEGFILTRYSEEFRLQMEIAEEGMREYRDALSELAK
jgi:putative addiction module antidote